MEPTNKSNAAIDHPNLIIVEGADVYERIPSTMSFPPISVEKTSVQAVHHNSYHRHCHSQKPSFIERLSHVFLPATPPNFVAYHFIQINVVSTQ